MDFCRCTRRQPANDVKVVNGKPYSTLHNCYTPLDILSLSFHFNSDFPGGPGLAGSRMSSFWILLELRVMEVVMITGAIRCAKLQSKCRHQQTNTQLLQVLPVAQPTVSKHWREALCLSVGNILFSCKMADKTVCLYVCGQQYSACTKWLLMERPWLSGQGYGLAPSEFGFNSRWYPYESLVAAARASGQNYSHAPVKVLPR